MRQGLNPIQLRRLVARTLTTSLGGGPAPAQLFERWAVADAPYDTWLAALTWDGVGPTLGWALRALDLREVAAPEVDSIASDAFEDAQRQCLAFTADLLRVGAEFDAAGVRAIDLKGSALLIGNVVPSPGARWMGDLDVLVPESQAEQAGWALESLGYTRSIPRSAAAHPVFRPYHETFTGEARRALELHWRIGPARWGPAADGAGWFDRASPRDWDVHRVAEAVAWGATLDRARRFDGRRGAIERAVRIIPEAVPGAGIVTSRWRFSRNLRHAGFVGALALAHLLFIVSPPGVRSRRLAGGDSRVPE